jgi:hypothetical protein
VSKNPNVFMGACIGLHNTLQKKREAYGDSFTQSGDFMRMLYPNGIPVEAMDDALTLVRIYDKMKRIANNPGKADPGGEDPFHDIAGHAILAQIRRGKR